MSGLPGAPLRIAVLGDFEGLHTQAWVRNFVERGHEIHAISYYRPRAELPGITLHVLSGEAPGGAAGVASRPGWRNRLPPSLMRLIHARRYLRAGLRRVLDEIRPDVFHAHYVVEHGFYGAMAGYHPYAVSAWGSDLLVESHKLLGRRIAKWSLSKADLVTGNDPSLVERAVELGVPRERTATVHLGIDAAFLAAGEASVNLGESSDNLIVVSDRALERLYNVDVVIRAFTTLQAAFPQAHLVIAGDGSQAPSLRNLANDLDLGTHVSFRGHLERATLANTLASTHVYISAPSSDSMALSNVEAMAAGAFPIVSDLPSVDGWIEDGSNGLRVSPKSVASLANAMRRALDDASLRREAAVENRRRVEARGLREPNMLLMERHYYRLAGRPLPEDSA